MRYYAIADLHGRFDLLEKAHNLILDTHTSDEPYHIITMGDYIDRGPDSRLIIEYLMNESSGNTFISLKGNHEDMMVQTIRKPLDPDWWLGNGGNTTMKSYGSEVKVSPYYGIPPVGWDPHVVYPSHVDWIANLPYYYETEKQLFVHAGVPQSNMNLPPKHAHHIQDMMWMLYSKDDGRGWKDKHVVHGHHQFADGPHEWQGRTDLDCFAWKTGRLVVGVFDDTQGKALRYLEVLGDDYVKDKRSIEAY